MRLRDTQTARTRRAEVSRSYGPGDGQMIHDFFVGAGLVARQEMGRGDIVECVHEGHVYLGKIVAVEGLQALVDLGNGTNCVRKIADLVLASETVRRANQCDAVREAVRKLSHKSPLRIESETHLQGCDYRLGIGHDTFQVPTQAEVLRFVCAQYPDARVLDGETARPGLLHVVIARGEGHELPQAEDVGPNAYESVQGPQPRSFDDEAFDVREREHIGGPGLQVAQISEEPGEQERRTAIFAEWDQAYGRKPTAVEYARAVEQRRQAHRMPPAQAGFHVGVTDVRSRGAYIEAVVKFDRDTAVNIGSLALKQGLKRALLTAASQDSYRYGFVGHVRIMKLDRAQGHAVLEAQATGARNFPLEFVGASEDERHGHI